MKKWWLIVAVSLLGASSLGATAFGVSSKKVNPHLPRVSALEATPAHIGDRGGLVKLTARVKRGRSCVFFGGTLHVPPRYSTTVPCRHGSVRLSLRIPANTTFRTRHFTYSLNAWNADGESNRARVTVVEARKPTPPRTTTTTTKAVPPPPPPSTVAPTTTTTVAPTTTTTVAPTTTTSTTTVAPTTTTSTTSTTSPVTPVLSWEPVDIDLAAAGLVSVSCPTSSFCAAVDQAGNVIFFSSGHGWALPKAVEKSFAAISCASSTFCMAVDGDGDAWVYDGSSWAELAPVSVDGLTAVSCPSATFCAVTDDEGDAFVWDGTSFTETVGVVPGAASVSCVSAQFCAVGGQGTSIYNGSAWTTPANTDEDSIISISCVSASFCDALGVGDGDVLHWNGEIWASTPVLSVPAHSQYATALSCGATDLCVAADNEGNVSVWNGTAWSGETALGDYISSLSCADDSFCVAVDEDGDALTGQRT